MVYIGLGGLMKKEDIVNEDDFSQKTVTEYSLEVEEIANQLNGGVAPSTIESDKPESSWMLWAGFIFPPFWLIYLILNHADFVKKAGAGIAKLTWESWGSSPSSAANTPTSGGVARDGDIASSRNGKIFVGGDGNVYEMGGMFCDWSGNHLPWGSAFRDSRGNLVEWGQPFYDNKDNYCTWGSPFYDAGNNYICP